MKLWKEIQEVWTADRLAATQSFIGIIIVGVIAIVMVLGFMAYIIESLMGMLAI